MTYLTIDQRKNTIIEMMRTLPTIDCARLLYDCTFDADILNTDDIIANCPDEQDALEDAFCTIIKYIEDNDYDPDVRTDEQENGGFWL